MRHFRALGLSAFGLLSFLASESALGWGATGHRVIGEIAERHIGARTRTCVRALLGGESLAIASTWGDEIRSDPSYAKSSPWHYVEIPDGKTIGDIKPPPEGNTVTALADQERILLNQKESLIVRANALRLLNHFIGDLHQPLHIGNGTDRGGNSCEVIFFGEGSEPSPAPPTRAFRRKINLHWVWDEGLIARTNLTFSEYSTTLDRALSKTERVSYAKGNLHSWIDDSKSERESVYPKPKSASPRGPHPYCLNVNDAADRLPSDFSLPDLSWDYLNAMQPLLNRQLQKGGVRLAATLDRVFKKSDCKKLAREAAALRNKIKPAGAVIDYRY